METIYIINNKFKIKPISADKIYSELIESASSDDYHQLSSMQSLELVNMLDVIIRALSVETGNLYESYMSLREDLEEYKKNLLLQLYEEDLI